MAGLLAVKSVNRNRMKMNDHRERAHFGANVRGFSLLEVLIALLVLMLGMLGLAWLQTIALSNQQSSFLRSQAIIQAHDISDRMFANPAGVIAGAYNSIGGTVSTPPTCLTTATGGDTLSAVDCTPAQMAQFDANEWNTANAYALPSGQGTVVGPVGGIYTVTVSWVELEKSGADTKTFTFQVKPMP